MDKKTKEALRRYKKSKARESSESSSSSSETGSSSSYSSSDSEAYRRHRKKKRSRSEKREHCQKKLEAKRDHLKRKLKEAKLKKRAAAAAAVLSGRSHRSSLSPSTQAKLKKLAERQHLREVSKDAERASKHRAHKLRLEQSSKSPTQHMHQLLSREKIIIQTRTHDRHTEQKLRHEERRERERERERKLRREEEEQQLTSEREVIYASGGRVYSSRERSMELERTRYSSKRERASYIEADRHLMHERRREVSPYAPRIREVYAEEERAHHSRERGTNSSWLEHEEYRERDLDLMYGDDRKATSVMRGGEWKNNWTNPREPSEWPTKKTSDAGLKMDTDWANVDSHKKPAAKSAETWWEHAEKPLVSNANVPLPAATCPEPQQFWPNEWQGVMEDNHQYRGARNPYRERVPHMPAYRPVPPVMLAGVAVPQAAPPARMYHNAMASPRMPNKRNMTYTNPNLIKKQQAAALAAMKSTAVAAAKAAAQSAANATTNPGILGQARQQQQQLIQQQQQQQQFESGENNKEESTNLITASMELDKVSGELSEISDSDDDILNNVDKKLTKATEVNNSVATTSTTTTTTSTTTTTEIELKPTLHKTEEVDVEEDILDFEEISDGELEEDGTRHKQVSDALGVDWASLISETKLQAIENNGAQLEENLDMETAKQRWQTHRILLNLGISFKMAGEEFSLQLLREAQSKLHSETRPTKCEETKVSIKEEKKVEQEPKLLLDNLPAYAFAQGQEQRRLQAHKQLFVNICGPFSRALSARQDLSIRRQLCLLPTNDDEFTRPLVSARIKHLALNAFKTVCS